MLSISKGLDLALSQYFYQIFSFSLFFLHLGFLSFKSYSLLSLSSLSCLIKLLRQFLSSKLLIKNWLLYLISFSLFIFFFFSYSYFFLPSSSSLLLYIANVMAFVEDGFAAALSCEVPRSFWELVGIYP